MKDYLVFMRPLLDSNIPTSCKVLGFHSNVNTDGVLWVVMPCYILTGTNVSKECGAEDGGTVFL
jgi:hypothetical protein